MYDKHGNNLKIYVITDFPIIFAYVVILMTKLKILHVWFTKYLWS